MLQRIISHLYHVMNILSGRKIAPVSDLGTILAYLAIVEFWILAILWSSGVKDRWLSFGHMRGYGLLDIYIYIFLSCGDMGYWPFLSIGAMCRGLWIIGYLLLMWNYGDLSY